MTSTTGRILLLAAMALTGCASAPPAPVALDHQKWRATLKQERVSIRTYEISQLQASAIGGAIGGVVGAVLTRKPLTDLPETSELLASAVKNELTTKAGIQFDELPPQRAVPEDFAKPVNRGPGEGRFILKVAVVGQYLNHLPMAWLTDQYWLGGKATLIDSTDGGVVWESSCWFGLDTADKSRQLDSSEESTPEGKKKLAAIIQTVSQRCASVLVQSAEQRS